MPLSLHVCASLLKKLRRHRILDDGEIDEEGFPRWFLFVAYGACSCWCIFSGLYSLAVAIYFGPGERVFTLQCSNYELSS
eukprot:SAG31_NODE_238_length_19470_cov_8.921532_8_plen_80_part_00